MSSSTSGQFQNYLENFYSRRSLLHNPFHLPPDVSAASPPPLSSHFDATETLQGDKGFDANVIMILSVLLCAVVCTLGTNFIFRCMLRCSQLVNSDRGGCSRPVNAGIRRKVLMSFPTVRYSANLRLAGLDADCPICLSEFATGERLRLLPNCNHGFHVKCIDKWLTGNSSCPKCRRCLIQTHQKTAGCNSSVEAPPAPVEEGAVVNIAPLEHEDLVRNFRDT